MLTRTSAPGGAFVSNAVSGLPAHRGVLSRYHLRSPETKLAAGGPRRASKRPETSTFTEVFAVSHRERHPGRVLHPGLIAYYRTADRPPYGRDGRGGLIVSLTLVGGFGPSGLF